MTVLDTMQNRRSIKHYDANHRIPEADVTRLIEAAMLAPTSFNIQHWRFVRVCDRDLRGQLRAAAWGQAQVTDASELLIVTGDISAWSDAPERYWRNTEPEVQKTLVAMLQDFYRGREWLQRDEAIRSGAMAAQNIMLAAEALGYQTSPMIGFDMDQVADLINLPTDHVIVMMLAIGKGEGTAKPRGGQLELDEVLVADRF